MIPFFSSSREGSDQQGESIGSLQTVSLLHCKDDRRTAISYNTAISLSCNILSNDGLLLNPNIFYFMVLPLTEYSCVSGKYTA